MDRPLNQSRLFGATDPQYDGLSILSGEVVAHATELIRQGWDMAHVQKRLGHADIQTTINTYTHLTDDDLKRAYHQYLEQLEKQKEAGYDT